MNPNSLEKAI